MKEEGSGGDERHNVSGPQVDLVLVTHSRVSLNPQSDPPRLRNHCLRRDPVLVCVSRLYNLHYHSLFEVAEGFEEDRVL